MILREITKEVRGNLKCVIFQDEVYDEYVCRFYKDGYLLETSSECVDDIEDALRIARNYTRQCRGIS
jgi:hypothetical protein